MMKRAVRTVIRVAAGGLVVVGGMITGLEIMRGRIPGAEISVWRRVVGIVLVALGLFLFAASRSLAEQLTDDFDDDGAP